MNRIFTVTLVSLLLLSCKKNLQYDRVSQLEPLQVTASIYRSESNKSQPVIYSDTDKQHIVPAGSPKITMVNTNVHTIKSPETILLKSLPQLKALPGSISTAKLFQTRGEKILAGSPQVNEAKDAVAKDQNLFNFSSYGTLQGLVNASIYALLEDKRGNLWIGTYGGGVCRFDGVSFNHYTVKDGLAGNTVVAMIEDRNENIWFGTLGGGVCKYDGKNFTRFTEKDGLGSDFVHCILEDRNGDIWFGTDGAGATKFEPYKSESTGNNQLGEDSISSGTFSTYTEAHGLPGDNIWTISKDKKGDLLFGTGGKGVFRFNGKMFLPFNGPENLMKGVVKVIHEDIEGALWLGTWSDGLYIYKDSVITHFTAKEGLSNNNIAAFLEDPGTGMWIGTEGGGLNLYKFKDSSMDGKSTITQFTSSQGLSDNFVNTIFKDRNGILWIGTNRNLNKYRGNSIFHFTEKVGVTGAIKSVIESKNGDLWFGGGAGLNRYDGRSISHYTKKEGLLQDNVNALLEDKNGNIWIGAYDGVSKFDGKSFHYVFNNTSLKGNNVHSIKEDEDGNIWFGLYSGGVAIYNGKSFTRLTTRDGLNSNWIWTTLLDSDGNLWFGSSDRGIFKLKTAKGKNEFSGIVENNSAGYNNVESVFEDSYKNIWFTTTDDGVRRFDPSQPNFRHSKETNAKVNLTSYSTREGLVNDYVNGILEDKNHNLWFTTDNGVSILNKNFLKSDLQKEGSTDSVNMVNIRFKNLDYEDGFQGIASFQNAICEDKNGTIWVGTMDRLTAIRPEKMIKDTVAPVVQLTSIGIFNEYIPWQFLEEKTDSVITLENGQQLHDFRFNHLDKWLNIPQGLSLPYDNNHINLRYVAATTNLPRKMKYQDKLEGLENTWSIPSNRTETYFNNLAHGKYTFKVRAMNSEGYWSGETAYAFIIRPPWWLSTPAYIFYVLCVLAAFFYTDRYQRKRLLAKQREVFREKELAHGKEIEKAYHQLEQVHENLKATQTQLIQSEKMASLGQIIAGIAHEIQNPLNFVNNFSEVSSELIDEMKESIDKGDVDQVKLLSEDIRQNLEKINQHGKRADVIVKGMLQHNRSNRGEQEVVDINELTDEYVRLAYHGYAGKQAISDVKLTTYYDELAGKASVFAQDIGRVIVNILNNAFFAVGERAKAEEGYEPEIIVYTKRNENTIAIAVKDNGFGIPESEKNKIFQPFYTTKPPGQGTGLGLSLSFDIVKAHGGEIVITSSAEEGTEVRIIIKAAQQTNDYK